MPDYSQKSLDEQIAILTMENRSYGLRSSKSEMWTRAAEEFNAAERSLGRETDAVEPKWTDEYGAMFVAKARNTQRSVRTWAHNIEENKPGDLLDRISVLAAEALAVAESNKEKFDTYWSQVMTNPTGTGGIVREEAEARYRKPSGNMLNQIADLYTQASKAVEQAASGGEYQGINAQLPAERQGGGGVPTGGVPTGGVPTGGVGGGGAPTGAMPDPSGVDTIGSGGGPTGGGVPTGGAPTVPTGGVGGGGAPTGAMPDPNGINTIGGGAGPNPELSGGLGGGAPVAPAPTLPSGLGGAGTGIGPIGGGGAGGTPFIPPTVPGTGIGPTGGNRSIGGGGVPTAPNPTLPVGGINTLPNGGAGNPTGSGGPTGTGGVNTISGGGGAGGVKIPGVSLPGGGGIGGGIGGIGGGGIGGGSSTIPAAAPPFQAPAPSSTGATPPSPSLAAAPGTPPAPGAGGGVPMIPPMGMGGAGAGIGGGSPTPGSGAATRPVTNNGKNRRKEVVTPGLPMMLSGKAGQADMNAFTGRGRKQVVESDVPTTVQLIDEDLWQVEQKPAAEEKKEVRRRAR